MPIVASSNIVPSNWTSRLELERRFGATNIARWADVENMTNQQVIADNIEQACEDATDDVKSRLTGAACGVIVIAPRSLRVATTRLAGVLLYEARGVKDTADEEGKHRLKWHYDRAMKWIRAVQAGQIQLTGVTKATCIPFVAPHNRPVLSPFSVPRTPEEILAMNESSEVYGVPGSFFWWDSFKGQFQ